MQAPQLNWIANYIWGMEEILADILALHKETEGLLDEIIGGSV